MNKPRIWMRGTYYDGGYLYERWMCAHGMHCGYGPTPRAAWDDYMRRCGK